MPGPRLSPFAALRHRDFRLFYTGQSISLTGTWMQHLAQGWLVLQLTDSAVWVGLVSFLSTLPILLFSLPAGEFVDRADKHRVVMTCQALLLAGTALLATLVGLGQITAPEVGAIAFVLGCVSAIEIPARQSYIVELVGKDDLTNAIALNSSAFNATRIVGPSIAGLVVAQWGVTACFVINVFTYGAVLEAMRRMRRPEWRRPAEPGRPGARLREGLEYVRAEPRVFALIVGTAALSVLCYPFVVLLPVFARDVFSAGAEGLGLMSAAVGCGALLAALGLATLAPRVRRGELVAWSSILCGIAVAGFAFAPRFALAVVALALAGFTMVLNNAATNTLLQTLVPDALRGRVMALWSLAFVGLAPLGSLQAGWLAGLLGPGAAVALGGALSSLVALFIWRRLAPEVVRLR
jgi:MFS family permease